MHPYDLRLDIPARAIISAQIWAKVLGTKDGIKSRYEVISQFPIPADDYEVLDQAYVASLLYCLLVVPRELLKLDKNDGLYQQLDKERVVRHFDLRKKPIDFDTFPSYFLVRCLRNSVSHALYEIDGNNNWRFWTDRDPIWEALVMRDGLMSFLGAAGQLLADRCLRMKPRPHTKAETDGIS